MLAQEKIGRVNAKLALAEEKELRVGEPGKLVTVKKKAKTKLKKRALATVVKYAMCFRR